MCSSAGVSDRDDIKYFIAGKKIFRKIWNINNVKYFYDVIIQYGYRRKKREAKNGDQENDS